jgi:hypothetical protein
MNIAPLRLAGLPLRPVAVPGRRLPLRMCATGGWWINEWNKNPRPFIWAEAADEILQTLAAYCRRINSSGR